MERIIQGDCLDVLKDLPDNSVDAVVTDPPYGLSKEPNIREVLEKWLAGEDYHHRGGGFMGKTWDSFVPGPSVWREVFRVLKPGGHLLCFAGTRTQDLMTISLRLAGFEIRDVIEWLYFSGFPKSMDIGKQFDKRAGAEREVIGINEDVIRRNPNGQGGTLRLDGFSTLEELKEAAEKGLKCPNGRDARATYERTMKSLREMAAITAPATELARKWDGWGSSLKPAHEPILLCRKPLEGSICDNVERWGTGALNIDGCRIPTEDKLARPGDPHGGSFRFHGFSTLEELKEAAEKGLKTPDGRDAMKIYNNYLKWKATDRSAEPPGRFPANCVTLEPDQFYSKYFNITPPETDHEPIIMARKPLEGSICDNVEKWGTGAINIDGCRVSGEDISTSWNQRNVSRGGSFILHGFNTIDELREAAERGEKCPDGRDAKETYKRVLRTMNEQYKPNEKGRFPANCITTEPDMFYSKYFNITPPELCKKASKKDRLSTWDGGQVDANKHPTVKPVALMSWCIKLITPPGGVVLDPFAGSGSTLVAAKREGFGFIGIEKEPEYVEIAKARIGEKEETATRAAVFV